MCMWRMGELRQWDERVANVSAHIENSILCSHVRVGEKAQIKDCEFGGGYQAAAGAVLKNAQYRVED